MVVAPSHCFRVLARLPADCRSQHRLIAAPKVSAFFHLLYRNWTRQHTAWRHLLTKLGKDRMGAASYVDQILKGANPQLWSLLLHCALAKEQIFDALVHRCARPPSQVARQSVPTHRVSLLYFRLI